jgi:hypothetical protein
MLELFARRDVDPFGTSFETARRLGQLESENHQLLRERDDALARALDAEARSERAQAALADLKFLAGTGALVVGEGWDELRRPGATLGQLPLRPDARLDPALRARRDRG